MTIQTKMFNLLTCDESNVQIAVGIQGLHVSAWKVKDDKMRPEDIDKIFKMMDEMMNNSFTGGVYTGGCYPKNADVIYKDIKHDSEIDYSEDDDWIYITVELSGVERDDLTVDIKSNSIHIEVATESKTFKKDYTLSCKVNSKKSKICFNNYVLDIELKKVKEKKNGKGKDRRDK